MPTTKALAKLKNDLIALGEMCEFALDTALVALIDRDGELACYVIDYVREIDEMEGEIRRGCIEFLRHGDRKGTTVPFVQASAKIASDLQRVGELAAAIGEHVLFLVRGQSVLMRIVDFPPLVEQVSQMVRESVQALVEANTELARKIVDEHEVVHEEVEVVFRSLLEVMLREPRAIERCLHVFGVAQNLRRIAHLVTNIAEEVIFMEEGVVVRHRFRTLRTVEEHPFARLDPGEEARVAEALREAGRGPEATRREIRAARDRAPLPSEEELSVTAAGARGKASRVREKVRQRRGGPPS